MNRVQQHSGVLGIDTRQYIVILASASLETSRNYTDCSKSSKIHNDSSRFTKGNL